MSWVNLGFEHCFNNIMSYTNSHPHNIHIGTAVSTIPVEFLSAAENLIRLPFQAAGAVVKYPVAILGFSARVLCCGKNGLSEKLMDMQRALPGLKDVLFTAYKVIGFIIGTILTATIGLISSRANYAIHDKLGLIDPEMVIPELSYSYQNLQGNYSRLQTENGKLHDDISGLQRHIEYKDGEIRRITDAKSRLEREATSTAELRSTIQSLQVTNSTLEQRLRSQPNYTEQLATLQNSIREWSTAFTREQSAKTAAERSNQQLQGTLRDKDAEILRLRSAKPVERVVEKTVEKTLTDEQFFTRLQGTQQFHDLLDRLLGNNKELDAWRKASKELEALKQKLANNTFTNSDVPALIQCLEQHRIQSLNLQGQLSKVQKDLEGKQGEFDRQLAAKNEEVVGLKAKITTVLEQKSFVEQQLASKSKEIEELRQQLGTVKKQSEDRIKGLQAAKEEADRQKGLVEEKLKTETQAVERLRKQLDSEQSNADKFIRELQEAKQNADSQNYVVVGDLTTRLESAESLQRQLTQNLRQTEARVAELQKAKEAAGLRETELTGLLSTEKKTVESIRQQLSSEKDQSAGKTRDIQALKAELAEARQSHAGANNELAAENQRLKGVVDTLSKSITTLASKVKALITQNSPPGTFAFELIQSSFDPNKPVLEQLEFLDKWMIELESLIKKNPSVDSVNQLQLEEQIQTSLATIQEQKEQIASLTEAKSIATARFEQLEKAMSELEKARSQNTSAQEKDSAADNLVLAKLKVTQLTNDLQEVQRQNRELVQANAELSSKAEELKQQKQLAHRLGEEFSRMRQECERLRGECEANEPIVRRVKSAEANAERLKKELEALSKEKNLNDTAGYDAQEALRKNAVKSQDKDRTISSLQTANTEQGKLIQQQAAKIHEMEREIEAVRQFTFTLSADAQTSLRTALERSANRVTVSA